MNYTTYKLPFGSSVLFLLTVEKGKFSSFGEGQYHQSDKVLSNRSLARTGSHLKKQRRFGQSDVTPGDHILAFRVPMDRRHRFRLRMVASYKGLKKASDSVYCDISATP